MKIVQAGEIILIANSTLQENIQQMMEKILLMLQYQHKSQKKDSYSLGTGVTEYTKRNNIYDLAGNCWEWTTESSSSSTRVDRGRQL